jgi:signal recognition particle GTPase
VDVNRLIKQFELTKGMAKQMSGGGKKARRLQKGMFPFS